MIVSQETSQDAKGRKGRVYRVRISETEVGLGVFAERAFKAEQVVGELFGAIYDEADYSSDYCLDMGDGRCMEPDAPFRYLNHRCDPNCEVVWDETRRKDRSRRRRLWLMTLRDIEPGEELTIDYAWPADAAIPCRCNSPKCRGWIVAEAELPQLLAGAGSDSTADAA